MSKFFPASYHHFVMHGLTDLEPWTILDNAESVELPPDFERGSWASKQCKRETGARFDFYLFARRHDRDDYAFFLVQDGVIHDKVVNIHLSFVNKLELKTPLRAEGVTLCFFDWVRSVAIDDMKDWIDD